MGEERGGLVRTPMGKPRLFIVIRVASKTCTLRRVEDHDMRYRFMDIKGVPLSEISPIGRALERKQVKGHRKEAVTRKRAYDDDILLKCREHHYDGWKSFRAREIGAKGNIIRRLVRAGVLYVYRHSQFNRYALTFDGWDRVDKILKEREEKHTIVQVTDAVTVII